jgi:hypothetical protein
MLREWVERNIISRPHPPILIKISKTQLPCGKDLMEYIDLQLDPKLEKLEWLCYIRVLIFTIGPLR